MNNMAKKMNGYENNNRLISDLPDDIVISSILSLLPFKEVAKTSVLSRHWYHSWLQFTLLNFESWTGLNKLYNIKTRIVPDKQIVINRERCKFVCWVHHILTKHIGSVIDEFKITFDLENTYQSVIDMWVVWAFTKHVKKLELDFREFPEINVGYIPYYLHQPLIHHCFFTMKLKPLLTSLCLKKINVTTQVVQLFVVSCSSTLENLCIDRSDILTSIQACGSSSLQSLKIFKVVQCPLMETINIDAPKLLSFTYEGSSLRQLRVANASSLSQVSVFVYREKESISFALDPLSNYFPQLEYLNLEFSMLLNNNLSMDISSVLANLKHLQLYIYLKRHQNLFGWLPFVEACPFLEKLTLEIQSNISRNKDVKRARHPFRFLKTLEIKGFVDFTIDSELARFVFENGIALEEVVVDAPFAPSEAELQAWELKLPRGVKLTVSDERTRLKPKNIFPFPYMYRFLKC